LYSAFFKLKAFFSGNRLVPWLELKSWRPYVIIFIFGFLLYGQTLFFNFTYFDDQSLILEKAEILSSFKNIGLIFSNDVFFSTAKFYYRPILNLSFMLDAQFMGVAPFVFHLSNILIHFFVVALLFYFLCRLSRRRELSFFLSIIFLVHPVLSQAVAWIPGRNDSLLAGFVLASFIYFFNFLEKPRLGHYLLHLFFFSLALFTKEAAVVLPILCFFYGQFIFKGKLDKTDKVLLSAGYFSIVFVWFIMRSLAFAGRADGDYLAAFLGLINNLPALVLNIGKLIFPFNLSVLPVLADSNLFFGIFAIIILFGAWFISKRRRKFYTIFACLWFLLFLLPSFLRFNEVPDFLEHRLYVPFIGFLIFIMEIDWLKDLNFRKKTLRIVIILIILLFSIINIVHSCHFFNRLSFWQAAVKSSPHSPLAHRNLGAMYYLNNDYQKAETEYLAALALNDKEPMAHNNLGLIYLNRGNFWQAEIEFKKELVSNPNFDKATFNLGNLYYRQGKFAAARRLWQETLKINPEYVQATQGLNILVDRLK